MLLPPCCSGKFSQIRSTDISNHPTAASRATGQALRLLKKRAGIAVATSAMTLGLAACGGGNDGSDGDPIEQPSRALFNPAAGEFPVPNDFLFAQQATKPNESTDGTMSAGEDTNPVIQGIDALDGASVLAPIDIRFDAPLNTAQQLSASAFVVAGSSVIPNPNQNVFLVPLVYPGGNPLRSLDSEVPSLATAIEYQTLATLAGSGDAEAAAQLAALAVPNVRADIITLDGEVNQTLRIQPLEPLEPRTRYLVVVTNIEDAQGNAIAPSVSYEFLRNPESVFATVQAPLLPAAEAVRGWETLAAGYFGFMQSVYDSASIPSTAPQREDIVFSLTFTTTAVEDVLVGAAAPETFFEDLFTLRTRQQAIEKLMNGTYNLQGDASGVDDPQDQAVIQQLNAALTTVGSQAYDPAIAGAIASGATLQTFITNPSAIYLLQTTVASVAEGVQNAGPNSISAQAALAVENISTDVLGDSEIVQSSEVFPIPAARDVDFYRMDSAASFIGPAGAAAAVYQGSISLPQYQAVPSSDPMIPANPAEIYTSRWKADTTIANAAISSGTLPSDGAASEDMDADDQSSARIFGQMSDGTLGSDRISYSYPFPEKQDDLLVPLLATVPVVAPKPANGWPVVIFVHGITSDRSAAIPMSTALASACINPADGSVIPQVPCFASVAIDLPLHGIAARATIDPADPSNANDSAAVTQLFNEQANLAGAERPENLTERHFNFTADAQGRPVPMSEENPGASGSLFINLSQFDNVRDNLRQMVLDLLNVNASIADMDTDRDGVADFDTSRVYLVGHSLGGIAGLPFVAVNNIARESSFNDLPKVQAASAMLSGGELTRLLSNSPAFSARIQQGLFAASEGQLAPLSSALETYLSVFQGVLDGVDPTPYGSLLTDSASDTGLLLTEIVDGDNGPDQTIPNAADSRWNVAGNNYGPLSLVTSAGFMVENIAAPLAGTEPMFASYGAVSSNGDTLSSSDGDAEVLFTRFTEGEHATPISGLPTNVFTEMVRQKVAFFAGNGLVQGSIVSDESIVND